MSDPGSRFDLASFARWCRAEIDSTLASDEPTALLVADGPDVAQPLVLGWHLDGQAPPTEELLAKLIPAWIEQTSSSQIAVVVPFTRPRPGATLIALDEAGFLVERAYLDIGRRRLGDWEALEVELDMSAWQLELARNAGWQEFAKWRCRRCGSVCPGEAATIPSPCDFCASTEIERVPLETPLRDPDPAFNPVLKAILDLVADA